MGFPAPQGLYDPRNEHDACGVGFVAHIKGAKSHAIISQALEILKNIDHRGAVDRPGDLRKEELATDKVGTRKEAAERVAHAIGHRRDLARISAA